MPTPTLSGIDTAHWQTLNGRPLPALTFAIHKASQGSSYKDPTLPAFITRYRATVPYRGFMHYIEPPTLGSPEAQVANLAAAVDQVGGVHDGEFVLLDWERGSNGVIADLATVNAITLLAIAKWGEGRVMMYTNRRMTEPSFSKWRAQYPNVAICLANTRTSSLMPNNGWAECATWRATAWQYGSGPVAGFTGNVDWDMVLRPEWFAALRTVPPLPPYNPPTQWSVFPAFTKHPWVPGQTSGEVAYAQDVIWFKAGGNITRGGLYDIQTEFRFDQLKQMFGIVGEHGTGPKFWAAIDYLAGH